MQILLALVRFNNILKKQYEETYADYLVKYLDAYESEGINIWGLTPVNEPHGNNGQWESMHFTPESQNEFIKKYLGPNHVGNFYGAPIMINTETQHVYYTPIYYILAQFSKTIRPGNYAVKTKLDCEGLESDSLHACATINGKNLLSIQILNTTKEDITCNLQIKEQYCEVTIDKNSLQTIQIQL